MSELTPYAKERQLSLHEQTIHEELISQCFLLYGNKTQTLLLHLKNINLSREEKETTWPLFVDKIKNQFKTSAQKGADVYTAYQQLKYVHQELELHRDNSYGDILGEIRENYRAKTIASIEEPETMTTKKAVSEAKAINRQCKDLAEFSDEMVILWAKIRQQNLSYEIRKEVAEIHKEGIICKFKKQTKTIKTTVESEADYLIAKKAFYTLHIWYNKIGYRDGRKELHKIAKSSPAQRLIDSIRKIATSI